MMPPQYAPDIYILVAKKKLFISVEYTGKESIQLKKTFKKNYQRTNNIL